MKHPGLAEFQDDVNQCGRNAIACLNRLIVDAVGCCDDRRVAALTRILRDVEMLLKVTEDLRHEQSERTAPAGSFQEHEPLDRAQDKDRVAQGSHIAAGGHDFDALTPREKQIIRHMANGSANKVIARNLNITESTVKVHIKALLRKLGLKNRTQVALYAIQQRWVD